MTEQEIIKQAWICSSVIDNSNAKSVFTMGEREALNFARAIEREQQKRIEELEAVINLTYKQHCGRDLMHLPLNEAIEKSLARVKRESLQRAVEICTDINSLPTYKEGGTATCEESACYDTGLFDCAKAIKKEMEELDND